MSGQKCTQNIKNKTVKLTKEQKRGIARKVDLEAGIVPPKSAVFANKKKYNRKKKHNNEEFNK